MEPRSRPDYPQSVQDTIAVLGDISGRGKYESYHDFIASTGEEFSDFRWIQQQFEMKCYISESGIKDVRNTLYALDIGTFTPGDPAQYSISASPGSSTAADVAHTLRSPPAGTKMRVLVFEHGGIYDHRVVAELASFYDINPRLLRDHLYQHNVDTATSNLNAWARDTYPGYLPSEAILSPITLERSFLTRPKKTTLFIPHDKGLEYHTVIALIWSPVGRYSKNVVNRDLIIPSQRISTSTLENLWQPSSDVETCLFRLSQLGSQGLKACVATPILVVQPFLRTYFLEISQDIKHIQSHVNYKGLSEPISDRDMEPRGSIPNMGRVKDMPFQAFQKLNDSFTASLRTIKDLDHPLVPWFYHERWPERRPANGILSNINADAQRVQEQMVDLRAKINELSAYSAGQESIREARKSVAQAESVTQLTRLAFFYIPLTFATSLFGINISEWQGDEMPSGKWFIFTSIICTFLTLGVAMAMAQWSDYIESHGGVWRSLAFAIGSGLWRAVFFLLATLPRMISESLARLWKKMRGGREDSLV